MATDIMATDLMATAARRLQRVHPVRRRPSSNSRAIGRPATTSRSPARPLGRPRRRPPKHNQQNKIEIAKKGTRFGSLSHLLHIQGRAPPAITRPIWHLFLPFWPAQSLANGCAARSEVEVASTSFPWYTCHCRVMADAGHLTYQLTRPGKPQETCLLTLPPQASPKPQQAQARPQASLRAPKAQAGSEHHQPEAGWQQEGGSCPMWMAARSGRECLPTTTPA